MNKPAPTTDLPGSPRAAPRTNLYLAATLIGEDSRLPVTIRNLSSTGALIRSLAALEDLGPICLVRGTLRANGHVAWKNGHSGGIEFTDTIDLAAWAPSATGAAQMNVDRIIAQSRGEVAAAASRRPTDTAPVGSPRDLIRRIGEELAFASRRLEALASDLADDPAVIIRHAAQLQDLDITTQVLGHLTQLLGSEQPETLLPAIGMQDLRRRLERTPLG